MKAKYAQKITRTYTAIMVGGSLLFFGLGLAAMLKFNDVSRGVFWMFYPVILNGILLSRPIAKISERDVLILGGFTINIHQIISLEEGKKQGIKVRYLFQEMERTTATIQISDKDKPRLVADLLSINPGIEIKAASLAS